MPQQPKITGDTEQDSWALEVTNEVNTLNEATGVDLGPVNTRLTAVEMQAETNRRDIAALDTEREYWYSQFTTRQNPTATINVVTNYVVPFNTAANTTVHSNNLTQSLTSGLYRVTFSGSIRAATNLGVSAIRMVQGTTTSLASVTILNDTELRIPAITTAGQTFTYDKIISIPASTEGLVAPQISLDNRGILSTTNVFIEDNTSFMIERI